MGRADEERVRRGRISPGSALSLVRLVISSLSLS